MARSTFPLFVRLKAISGAGVTERVCPRCGTAAGDNDYCSKCGLHLAEEAELPTREQWEARQAEQGETAAAHPRANLMAEPWSPAESGDVVSDPTQSGGGESGRGTIREHWSALGKTAKRSIVSGAAVVVVVVIVLLATSGGGGSPGTSSSAGNAGSDAGSAGSNTPTDAQVCASRWNSEASQLDRQMASSFAGGSGGSAAAGYEASDPSSCLITFSRGTGQYAAIMQFNEQGGAFVQGAAGTAAQLPGNWVWNATANSDGTVRAS